MPQSNKEKVMYDLSTDKALVDIQCLHRGNDGSIHIMWNHRQVNREGKFHMHWSAIILRAPNRLIFKGLTRNRCWLSFLK